MRVFLTGAAGGLGRALALELARKNSRLWLTDIDEAGLKETERLCLEAGAVEVRTDRLDVRHAEEWNAACVSVAKAWQGLDLLVNNAGVAVGGEFESQSLESWRWIVDINLWGVVHGCHYFYPLMQKQRSGAILNIASAAGLLSPPLLSSYDATKAAVVALSEALYAEGKEWGVHVSVACPTFFETGILRNARIADENMRTSSQKLFDWATCTAESVARDLVRAAQREKLYALPSWDARFTWRMKRLSPISFAWVAKKIMEVTKNGRKKTLGTEAPVLGSQASGLSQSHPQDQTR